MARSSRQSTNGDLLLKSSVPSSHVKLLTQPSVTVGTVTFKVTGRLAVYQIDHAPYMQNCTNVPIPLGLWWPWMGSGPDFRTARKYYRDVLRPRACSPCSVLASALPSVIPPVLSVPAVHTWPWEFDAYQWAHGFPSYVDGSQPDSWSDERLLQPDG